jgi:hypothetical protein
MSLHPQPFTTGPPETARVAHAAFPRGNLYMNMREELSVIYEDVAFAFAFGRTTTIMAGFGTLPSGMLTPGLSSR